MSDHHQDTLLTVFVNLTLNLFHHVPHPNIMVLILSTFDFCPEGVDLMYLWSLVVTSDEFSLEMHQEMFIIKHWLVNSFYIFFQSAPGYCQALTFLPLFFLHLHLFLFSTFLFPLFTLSFSLPLYS